MTDFDFFFKVRSCAETLEEKFGWVTEREQAIFIMESGYQVAS